MGAGDVDPINSTGGEGGEVGCKSEGECFVGDSCVGE